MEPETNKFPRWLWLPILLALVAVPVILWRHAGRWLIREDPLSPADAIVVLSGGLPYRAEEAAKVFALGDAPEVWVSRPAMPVELTQLNIGFISEEEYDRRLLIMKGVPAPAIHIFSREMANTEQEIEEISRQMSQSGKTRVIIVTSPEHTRRVRALWRSLAGKNQQAIVHAAFQDPFDADHWWRNTHDALAVEHEILGLVNVWLGLPVRPRAE